MVSEFNLERTSNDVIVDSQPYAGELGLAAGSTPDGQLLMLLPQAIIRESILCRFPNEARVQLRASFSSVLTTSRVYNEDNAL